MNTPATLLHFEYLRATAQRLERENHYQWGHMGYCNCGYLAQEINKIHPAVIHKSAMNHSGDWREQLREYCPVSGLPMDQIIVQMEKVGFSIQDLINLERLEDRNVLKKAGVSHLRHNHKSDVLIYLRAWADLLEEQWTANQKIEELLNSIPSENMGSTQLKVKVFV
jgi:hypothetical protein